MSSMALQGNLSGSLRGTKRLGLFRAATFIVALLTGVLSYSRIGQAQGFYGSITGTVTDNTGALVPEATVDLTNSATGVKAQTTSNGAGLYTFPNLQPGMYQLTFTKTGFKTPTRGSIDVQVASNLRVDIALPVGSATETAEVIAETPILQTQDASLGNTIEGRAVTDMPLNGRNVYALVSMVPGAAPPGGTCEDPLSLFAAANFQIGGGGANQSSSTFDGAPLNVNYLHETALVPSQDAVQEFKVQTNNLGPEYGNFLGGVMNMTSKSGGDSFSGSGYEFIRNKVLNANTWFNNRLGSPRPAFTQNQYGVTVGGPIHQKTTFFFFSWEGLG